MGAQLGSLEEWGTGVELFDSLEREDGETVFEKDLRPFLEECDQLQGVQVFAGVDDAWGGFADRLLEQLRDDMGKGVVWVWGLEDSREKPLVSAVYTLAEAPALVRKNLLIKVLRYRTNWHVNKPISPGPFNT